MGASCSSYGACKSSNKYKKNSIKKIVKQTLRADSQNFEQFNSISNYISQQHWMKKHPFLATEKFSTSYKEYIRDQTFVSEVWNKADVNEENVATIHHRTQSQAFIPRLKVLIRTGIPLDKVSHVVLELFKKAQSYNDVEYECALRVAFPAKAPPAFKNVPLFSFSPKIEEVLPIHYLNKDGLEAFKRIMWIYEKNVPLLEYSPLLSQVVALLLVFLKEHETYCVVKEMLDQSQRLLHQQTKKGSKKNLKWHFTLTKSQFEASMESLSVFIKDKTNGFKNVWKHFKKINYDCNQLFWKLIKTLFFEYLPLSISLKVFMAYMNEGVKIYYRFILALLQIFEADILQCNSGDSILSLIKEKGMAMTKNTVQLLTNTAYGLNLRPLKQKFSIAQSNDFSVPESTRLYFPELTTHSSIASTLHFETIWEWLPHDLKLTKPILAYTSNTHGWSINTLYARCAEKSFYKGALLLIQTADKAVFGAFIDGRVELHSDSVGTHESFVFKLAPEEKKYASSRKNRIYMLCSKESLSIGAGHQGSAIYLGSDLLSGHSYKSETYHNEPLNYTKSHRKNHFECSAFEVYWID